MSVTSRPGRIVDYLSHRVSDDYADSIRDSRYDCGVLSTISLHALKLRPAPACR